MSTGLAKGSSCRRSGDIKSRPSGTISQRRRPLVLVAALINVFLPPEILGEIFKLYMLMCTECFRFEEYNPNSQKSPYRWYRVASVCRYWRSVALSTAELFARVDLTRSQGHFTSEWLAHSGKVPLQIIGHLTPTNNCWGVISPHMERISKLNVYVQTNACLPSAWPSTLLNLTSLSCTYLPHELHLPPHYEVVKELLNRSPNLKSLAMRIENRPGSVWTSYISHRFLTRLRIHGWGWPRKLNENRNSDLLSFVSLIRRLPQLDILELDAFEPVYENPYRTPHHSVVPSVAQPLTCFKANGALASIIPILASRAIAPRMLNIVAFHYKPLRHDDDIKFISSTFINTPGTPWRGIISTRIGIDTSIHRDVYEFSLKGWLHHIPSIVHRYTSTLR